MLDWLFRLSYVLLLVHILLSHGWVDRDWVKSISYLTFLLWCANNICILPHLNSLGTRSILFLLICGLLTLAQRWDAISVHIHRNWHLIVSIGDFFFTQLHLHLLGLLALLIYTANVFIDTVLGLAWTDQLWRFSIQILGHWLSFAILSPASLVFLRRFPATFWAQNVWLKILPHLLGVAFWNFVICVHRNGSRSLIDPPQMSLGKESLRGCLTRTSHAFFSCLASFSSRTSRLSWSTQSTSTSCRILRRFFAPFLTSTAKLRAGHKLIVLIWLSPIGVSVCQMLHVIVIWPDRKVTHLLILIHYRCLLLRSAILDCIWLFWRLNCCVILLLLKLSRLFLISLRQRHRSYIFEGCRVVTESFTWFIAQIASLLKLLVILVRYFGLFRLIRKQVYVARIIDGFCLLTWCWGWKCCGALVCRERVLRVWSTPILILSNHLCFSR